MPKRMTLKTLTQELHNVAEESPAAVSIKVGGTSYALTGTYVGTVAGEQFGAVIVGDTTLIVELQKSGTMRNAKLLTNPDVAAVAQDLLPEPEPPAEVKAAQEALAALPRLPRGYRYELVKGSLTVVEDDGRDPLPRTRAPRGSAQPKAKKPEVVKGMILTRSKDGYKYKVTGVDTNLKKVYFEPANKGEGDEGLAQGYPAPVFWKNWQEVQ